MGEANPRTGGRPEPEDPRDVVPAPAEFAGWPRAGTGTISIRVGPIDATFVGVGELEARALASLVSPPDRVWGGGSAAAVPLTLELLRSERANYLAPVTGRPLRLATWDEGAAWSMATHGAALLLDPASDGGRSGPSGLVLLARDRPELLGMTLQNVLRVAVAWALASTGRGVLLHAAAVEPGADPERDPASARGEGAVLLVGASGAGKTTALGLLGGTPVLADDVALVEAPHGDPRDGARWTVHETPLWAEVTRRRAAWTAARRPLRSAVGLQKADQSAARSVSRAEGLALLAAHAPFKQDEVARRAGREPVALRLGLDVPVARLAFNREAPLAPIIESLPAGATPVAR